MKLQLPYRKIGLLTLLATLFLGSLSCFWMATTAKAEDKTIICTETTRRWTLSEIDRTIEPMGEGWQMTVRYRRTDQVIVRQYRIHSGSCRTNSGRTIRHRVGKVRARQAVKATFIPPCEDGSKPDLVGECPPVVVDPPQFVCQEGFVQISDDLCRTPPLDTCGSYSSYGPDNQIHTLIVDCGPDFTGDPPVVCSPVVTVNPDGSATVHPCDDPAAKP